MDSFSVQRYQNLVAQTDIAIVGKASIYELAGVAAQDGAVVEAAHIQVEAESSTAVFTSGGEFRTSASIARDGDFRSNGSTAWSTASTWDVFNGKTGAWVTSTSDTPGTDDRVTILTEHTVNITSDVSKPNRLTIEGTGTVRLDGAKLTLRESSLSMATTATIEFYGTGTSDRGTLHLIDVVVDGKLSVPSGRYGEISSDSGKTAIFGPNCDISVSGDLELTADYSHQGAAVIESSGELRVEGDSSFSTGSWCIDGNSSSTLTFAATTTTLRGSVEVLFGELALEGDVTVFGDFVVDDDGAIDTKYNSTTYTLDAYGEDIVTP